MKTELKTQYVPENLGLAVIEKSNVEIFGLRVSYSKEIGKYESYIKGTGDRERYTVPFKLNDRYIKQGNIESYFINKKKAETKE